MVSKEFGEDKQKHIKSSRSMGDSIHSEEKDENEEAYDDNLSDIFRTERESYNRLAKDLITYKKPWNGFM